MEVKELRNDDIVKSWLSDIQATAATRGSYLESMHQYTTFTKMTPDELLKEAETEIRSGLLQREQSMTKYLREFREMLERIGNEEDDKREELAPLTIKSRMTAVRSFYRWHQIPIPVLPKAAKKAKAQLKRKKLPDKDLIRAVLRVTDPLERAMVLVGVSSGLSAIDIADLRIHHFAEGYDETTGITTIHFIRTKTQTEFYTFLTPEASEAVHQYLEYRKRSPKIEDNKNGKRRADQLEKQRIVSDDGYLFVLRNVPDEYFTTKSSKKRENMRAWDTDAILAMYRRLNEEAQTSAARGEYNVNRTHNMRRFFATTLLNEGAQQYLVDYLQGHEIDATHEAYYRGNPAKLRDEYEKYIPLLTIQKALDISESPEYLRIKQENETLAKETARHVVERSELQSLREEIEKLKAEKAQMVDTHWETVAEHRMDEEASELFHQEDIHKMQIQLDQQSVLIAALSEKLGINLDGVDFRTPMTKKEQKAAKNSDW